MKNLRKIIHINEIKTNEFSHIGTYNLIIKFSTKYSFFIYLMNRRRLGLQNPPGTTMEAIDSIVTSTGYI